MNQTLYGLFENENDIIDLLYLFDYNSSIGLEFAANLLH